MRSRDNKSPRLLQLFTFFGGLLLSQVSFAKAKIITDDFPSITTSFPYAMDRNEYLPKPHHPNLRFNNNMYPPRFHPYRRLRKLRRNYEGLDGAPKPFEYKYNNLGSPERFHNIQDILNYQSPERKFPDAIQFSGHYKYLKGKDFSKYLQKVQKKQQKMRMRQLQLQLQQQVHQQSSAFDPLFQYKPKSPLEVNLLALQKQKNRLYGLPTENSSFNKKKQFSPTKMSVVMDVFPKTHNGGGEYSSFKPMPTNFLDTSSYYNSMNFPQIYAPAKQAASANLWHQLTANSIKNTINSEDFRKDGNVMVHLNVFPKSKEERKKSEYDILTRGFDDRSASEPREGKQFFEKPIIVDLGLEKGSHEKINSASSESLERMDDFITSSPFLGVEEPTTNNTTLKDFHVPVEKMIRFQSKDAV